MALQYSVPVTIPRLHSYYSNVTLKFILEEAHLFMIRVHLIAFYTLITTHEKDIPADNLKLRKCEVEPDGKRAVDFILKDSCFEPFRQV
ncbi:hypothetical protein KIN20_002498 [Parelaphostrongylus tenuis]|uniref:Uncharacterized protein n=1 Tax=Parelaphostrongylus tenuis TaxID=148309 RepID=A0AAD5LVS8_PARTN|nr:hypothetical protein KIN20_002498 [Parelaphostrongylus tenuis]